MALSRPAAAMRQAAAACVPHVQPRRCAAAPCPSSVRHQLQRSTAGLPRAFHAAPCCSMLPQLQRTTQHPRRACRRRACTLPQLLHRAAAARAAPLLPCRRAYAAMCTHAQPTQRLPCNPTPHIKCCAMRSQRRTCGVELGRLLAGLGGGSRLLGVRGELAAVLILHGPQAAAGGEAGQARRWAAGGRRQLACGGGGGCPARAGAPLVSLCLWLYALPLSRAAGTRSVRAGRGSAPPGGKARGGSPAGLATAWLVDMALGGPPDAACAAMAAWLAGMVGGERRRPCLPSHPPPPAHRRW